MEERKPTEVELSAKRGDLRRVEESLAQGTDPEQALLAACRAGRRALVRTLVKRGVAMPALDRALCEAVPLDDATEEMRRRQTNIMRLLIKHGADTRTSRNLPLRTAVENGAVDAVHLLLEFGADASAVEADDCPSSDLRRLIASRRSAPN